MSRLRSFPGSALAVLCATSLTLGVTACDEEGKTAPARCADPALPIYDIQNAGAPADDFDRFNDHPDSLPCITPVGHAINKRNDEGVGAVGGSSGSSGGGSGGTSSVGGAPGDAGAGGA